MNRENVLRRRILCLTWFLIAGLVLSGATAIPLDREVNWLVEITGARERVEASSALSPPIWAAWLVQVQTALRSTSAKYPFLFYGTDWLAFGHFAIAIAFIGALRDPVRNLWLYTFGLVVCVLVIPYAMFFGAVRGIPIWWRLIDCSFGALGFVPLWLCRRWAGQLERGSS